jgi:hypothetical protein
MPRKTLANDYALTTEQAMIQASQTTLAVAPVQRKRNTAPAAPAPAAPPAPAPVTTKRKTNTKTKTNTSTTQTTVTTTPVTTTPSTTTVETTKSKITWKTILGVGVIVVLLACAIIIPIYFLVIKKSSDEQAQTPASAPAQAPASAPAQAPAYTPTYKKTDEHISKAILYGPDGLDGRDDKLITEYSLYYKDNKLNDDINKKIKNLVTELTLYSENTNQKFIKKIKIKNCKIILQRSKIDKYGKTEYDDKGKPILELLEHAHYMTDTPNDWKTEKIPFPYYSSAIIYIMSEIILYNGMGNVIVNDKINNKHITEETVISNIQISGFKIKNCIITLYSDTIQIENGMTDTIIDKIGVVFHHSSKDDELNEEDDSKCYSRKSVAGAGYNRIKIVPIKD